MASTQPISAVICTLNEEANIAACIASVAGVDEVVVADDGSTDRTCEIAADMGARVFRRQDWSSVATAEDVDLFRQRFGWEPTFAAGTRIRNGHLEGREAIHAASHDWVVMPDADERVIWDLPAIRELLPTADQLVHPFIHWHNADGSPGSVGVKTKMFRQSLAQSVGRTHGVLLTTGRVVHTDKMRIDHLRGLQGRDSASPDTLAILEYSAAVDDDSRTHFYLGREYMYRGRHEHALELIRRYFAGYGADPSEVQKARVYEAKCLWALGRGDEARQAVTKAVLLNPDDRIALRLMADYHSEPWHSKWARLAEHATNADVLY